MKKMLVLENIHSFIRIYFQVHNLLLDERRPLKIENYKYQGIPINIYILFHDLKQIW